MVFVGHGQINNGQYHEDKRLQGNHQNMEDCPNNLQTGRQGQEEYTCAKQSGNQQENHFTGKHVAEQPQPQTDGLGEQADHLQHQIYGNQQPGIKRCKRELFKETPPLHLDGETGHQNQHKGGHAKGDVGVGGGGDLVVFNTKEPLQRVGDKVNRHQFHEVHHEHPDKYRQGDRRNGASAAVKYFFSGVGDELHYHFNEGLKAAGCLGGGFFCRTVKDKHDQRAEPEGPQQAIDVKGHKPHGG